MLKALIEFGAPIDGNGVATSCCDAVHYVCAGRFHQMDFSKAF